jgi:hypothetical protein
MKPKQLLILFALVVVLGALGFYVRNQQKAVFQKSTLKMGEKLLGEFDPNSVAEVRITSGSNVVAVAKKNDNWVVRQRNDYPANAANLSDLLQKFWKMKITEPVRVGPSRLPALDLVPPDKGGRGTVLDLLGSNGQSVRTVLLGKEHMREGRDSSPFGGGGFPDGRYVMVGNDAKNIALVNDPLSNVQPTPAEWLNKDFFKVEKIRSIAVTFPNATNSWKLTRETETAEWKLADAGPNEQLDTSKASGVANPLGSPSFTDVVPDGKIDESGTNKPTVVAAETFDEFIYTIKVGSKTNENYPLAMSVAANVAGERTPGKDEKPEDKDKLDKEFKEKQTKLNEKLAQEKKYEGWVYLVSGWSLDSLLKERSQLLAEKKEEKKEEAGTDGAPKPAGDAAAPPAEVPPPPPEPAPTPKP